MNEITQEYLKSILNYDPLTGIFIWINKPSKFNSIKIGDLAGYINTYTGYHLIRINRFNYPAHRLAWLYMYGSFPLYDIDHINHNRSDNRIENLREVTLQENQKNRSKNKNNTSGVTGIYWIESRKRWRVSISNAGKNNFIGNFKIKEDAIEARKQAEIELGYHQNHGL